MRLPLFTTNEAARMYHITPHAVRRWARQGRITNHGTQTTPRWNPRELEACLGRARPTGWRNAA